MTRLHPAHLLALLLPLALCVGCSATATPKWVDRDLESPSEQVLWTYALTALWNQGFDVGSGSNPGKLEIRSNWKKDLQVFRGKGTRKRATLKFTRLGDGRYSISARVETEVNMDITKPLDPTFAKWETAPDDESTARILVTAIAARVGTPLEIGVDDNASGIESWESLVVRSDSQRELTEDINRTLLALGYPLRKVPGPDRRLIQSNWAVELSPIPGQGRRVRATLRIQLLGTGRFRIRARVDQQSNRDRQNPLDPASADWVSMTEDRERTTELLEAIRIRSES